MTDTRDVASDGMGQQRSHNLAGQRLMARDDALCVHSLDDR